MAAEVGGHALKPTVGAALGQLAAYRLNRALENAYPDLTGSQVAVSPGTKATVGKYLRDLMLGKTASAQ
jgi:hypothetical protein